MPRSLAANVLQHTLVEMKEYKRIDLGFCFLLMHDAVVCVCHSLHHPSFLSFFLSSKFYSSAFISFSELDLLHLTFLQPSNDVYLCMFNVVLLPDSDLR